MRLFIAIEFNNNHSSFAGRPEEVPHMKLILVPECTNDGSFLLSLFVFLNQYCPRDACHLEIFFFPLGRSRSRSRSYSPSYSRRHDRAGHADNGHRSKPRAPKIEYITEFGGSPHHDDQKLGVSPPSSPFQADVLNRSEHSTFNSCKIDWTMFCLLQLVWCSFWLPKAEHWGLGLDMT